MKLLKFIPILFLSSCNFGPGAKLADGTVYWSGGSLLENSTTEGSKIVGPGITITYTKTGKNQTTGAGIIAGELGVVQGLKSGQAVVDSNNRAATAQHVSDNVVKTNQLAKPPITTLVPEGSATVTTPAANLIKP